MVHAKKHEPEVAKIQRMVKCWIARRKLMKLKKEAAKKSARGAKK